MRKTLRTLRRSPAFAAAAVLTLALGAGANTAAFSALRTLLLNPLPYDAPDRLVSLQETAPDGKPREVAEANLLDWQQRSTLFEAMAAFRPRSFGLSLSGQDQVTVIQTGMTTAGFFPVLHASPALGRLFTPEEEAADAHLLLLGDRLWHSRFAADPSVVGRKVFLNEEPFTVIGVLPPGVDYPMDLVLPEAFLPLSRRDYCCARLGSLAALARLKPGVDLAAARAELDAIAGQLALAYPATNRGRGVRVLPLAGTVAAGRREPLFLLLAASSLLLLIACANAAGLMLARGLARRREMAIRASLGANRWQLLRPFFAESLTLAAAGSACGLLGAGFVLDFVPRFLPGPPPAVPLALDPAAFLFATALAALFTVLLGAAPLLALGRADLAAWMKGAGRATARGPAGLSRAALVVSQVALCVVLLLSAGLLLRSFLRLLDSSPGFALAHAVRFGIGVPEKRYDTDQKLIAFHHGLLDRLAAIPGVAAAGAVQRFPLRGGAPGTGGTFQFAGSALPLALRPHASINVASPGYFSAMGIPLVAGREFSWRDDPPGAARVAIVNQAFARAYLGGGYSLGAGLEVRWVSDLNPAGSVWQIAGIVADIRQSSLDRAAVPEVFLSMTQVPCDGAGYVVRAMRDDPALAAAVAQAVARQDPRVQRVSVTPLRLLVRQTLAARTAAVQLVGAFGALALLLSAVGIYGIVSFRAAERSREMAVRMALGATAGQVLGLVLGHGLRLIALGLALGLGAFVFAVPLLRSQLFGVAAFDPFSIAAVAAGVALVAVAASLVPGRRAARQPPMSLLRD